MLGAESRLTLDVEVGERIREVAYDHATNVLSFSAPQASVGAVTFGRDALDGY